MYRTNHTHVNGRSRKMIGPPAPPFPVARRNAALPRAIEAKTHSIASGMRPLSHVLSRHVITNPKATVRYNPAVNRAVIEVRPQPQITVYHSGGPKRRASPSGTLTPITRAMRIRMPKGIFAMGRPDPRNPGSPDKGCPGAPPSAGGLGGTPGPRAGPPNPPPGRGPPPPAPPRVSPPP